MGDLRPASEVAGPADCTDSAQVCHILAGYRLRFRELHV
jgi:hypothetical protein